MVSGAKRKGYQTRAAVQPGKSVQMQVQTLNQSATNVHMSPQKCLHTSHTPPTACIVEVLYFDTELLICVHCVPVYFLGQGTCAATCTRCDMFPVGDDCAAFDHREQEYWCRAEHAHGKCHCAA